MATTTTTKPNNKPLHIALFPCAGMGHLMPFLRLASMLTSHGCSITFITVQPTVSSAESDHLSTFFTNNPQIKRLEFHLLPYEKSNFTNEDPFFIQVESICNSVHLLQPLLDSLSPPVSVIIADFPVISAVCQLASDMSIPAYTVITTSARFFSVMVNLPQLTQDNNGCVQIPGLGQMHVSDIPPPMLDANHFFAANITSNALSLFKTKGILINTFDAFESEAIQALKSRGPFRVLPIGLFEPFGPREAHNLPWLEDQGPETVLYISFGSRTALSKDQIREIGVGLEKSGCKFLWVLKTSKVDREDKEELEDILGVSFLERTKKQGRVIKGWVNQEVILAHPAIGGFVSHCGWNSVTEAARLGVPVLAWPLHGDQRVNAEVVEKAGLGLWVRRWGWGGEKLVDGNEIAEKIKELMLSESLRAQAKEVKLKAQRARRRSGTSEELLQSLIGSWKSTEKLS